MDTLYDESAQIKLKNFSSKDRRKELPRIQYVQEVLPILISILAIQYVQEVVTHFI